MHICYLAFDYHEKSSGGGIASYVNSVAEALVRRGHKVTVIAKGSKHEISIKDGIRIVRVPLGNLHWYLYKLRLSAGIALPTREIEWSFAVRRYLERLIRQDTIDIIEGCESALLFLKGGSLRSIPLVIRLHGEPYVFTKYSGQPIEVGQRMVRKMELKALRSAESLTAPSSFHAQEIASDLGWNDDRITVIPNPIDPWILERALNHTPTYDNNSRDTILYTGRIEYRKGTLVLLEAIPMVSQTHPRTEFVIAGARHISISDAVLNRLLNNNHVSRHVNILGHVSWRELVHWYSKTKIFVMPSYYETFGISVIEAMAFGLPVVATRAGGLSEVVEDGLTGILVPPGNPKALAEAVSRLLREPELRRRMGQAGRERVLAKFTIDRVMSQTLATYRALTNN